MGRRKISRWQSPSLQYEREVARVLKDARKQATRQDRAAEYRARRRAAISHNAEATGLRVIRDILKRPSPAGLGRLAGLASDPEQPGMVRAEASRAILVLAHGKVAHDDEK